MNSRKQVSNGCYETSMDDEQIRPVLVLQFQVIVDGTTVGNPGLEQEDGYHRGESWTGAGGWTGDEEDRGQHAGDDTEC